MTSITDTPFIAAKRARTEAAPGGGILRADVTESASRDALAAQYAAGQPYPHCVIPDICLPETLTAVREEIIQNVHATYKETDLFNMFQTGWVRKRRWLARRKGVPCTGALRRIISADL